MLVSSQKVRDAISSLVSGKDIVSVYNNDRFCEVVFTQLEGERVLFICSEVIIGPAVFSCPPYHFSAEIGPREAGFGLYSCALPDKVIVSQRRKFIRKFFKSSLYVDFQCQEEAFHVINLSMEGIDTESAHAPFTVDQEIKQLTISLEESSITVDATVRYVRQLPNGLYSSGFQFTHLNSRDARFLQKTLAKEDLWEPGDLSLST